MTSAADETQSIFASVLIFVFLSGSVIYALGYWRAVMHRANFDYKKTKAGLPAMRKGYWAAWWLVVKRGTLALLILLAVGWLWIKGGGSDVDAKQTPAPSPSVSVRHTHR